MIKSMKIPQERIPVLLGKNGKIKGEIESMTKTKIMVNDGISISGESIDVMVTENIIKAIGRGFSPEKALDLLDESMMLAVIPLPKQEKPLRRVKSRIIGSHGKCRERLEKYTKTYISVYGKTVSIIGFYDDVHACRKAIEKLISGATHRTVYKFLENKLSKNKGI